jgi:hypothetical protein
MPNEKMKQLVVVAKQTAGLRIEPEPGRPPTVAEGDAGPLANLLMAQGIRMRPLFARSEERLRAARLLLPGPVREIAPDLSVFYAVDAPDERVEELASQFRSLDSIDYAYVEPRVYLPVVRPGAEFKLPAPPSVTPDFSGNQGYLNAAPEGINARFAWTLSGGRGAGVNIIDIEGAWQLTHEDLIVNQGGLISGVPINDLGWRNHGTAVLGVVGADDNDFGVIGICPDANTRVVSHSNGALSFPSGVATAIGTASNALTSGDIILIEAHAPGPRFNFTQVAPNSQLGFVAMQYWPEVYAAITFAAVVKGIIVVEAGGNGAEDLDDPIYSAPPLGFPPLWAPFNRGVGDNASIIVGAGACPPGTHGRGPAPDRSRMDFSNFGACVDAQGWGTEVTTCGYGDVQGGLDENLWYTDLFGGTSSASPIVVGALACIQGALKAAGKPLLTPINARNLLRNIGSAQQDAPGRPSTQRIGNRPDLFLMLSGLV